MLEEVGTILLQEKQLLWLALEWVLHGRNRRGEPPELPLVLPETPRGQAALLS